MKATHIAVLIVTVVLSTALVLKVFSHEAKHHKPGTCVVSGEDLGSMGKPVKVTHDHTEVSLCCKSCIKEFNAHPGKYIAMIKAVHKH